MRISICKGETITLSSFCFLLIQFENVGHHIFDQTPGGEINSIIDFLEDQFKME
jgi:hypothetical protein